MGVEYKDYYRILGVDRSASQSEIQKAYRKLAKKYHPDKNPDDQVAENKFKEASEAYEVLKNPENRKKYDALGANWKSGDNFRAPPGWENIGFDMGQGPGMGGFSSFFESIFGGGGPGGQARGPHQGFGGGHGFHQQPRAQKGVNQSVNITITLEEAFSGAKRSLRITDPDTGQAKTLTVKIPKGSVEGTKIRLAGQGGPGAGGGTRGDMHLVVHFADHPRFKAKGHNLHATINLAPWEAALGAKISVPTLDGLVELKVPASVSSSIKMRLKGKGLPKSEGCGDIIATLQIVLPKQLSKMERKLFEDLAAHSKFDPRAGTNP